MVSSNLIEYAYLQATKNTETATCYGCILVHKGKIVSEGNNKRRGVRSSNITECPLHT